MLQIESDHLRLEFDPSAGDSVRRIYARNLPLPDPFGGALGHGPFFSHNLRVNDESITPPPLDVSSGPSHVGFAGRCGPLTLTRRYTLHAADFEDLAVYRNDGDRPLRLEVEQTTDLSDRSLNYATWGWRQMRYHLPDAGGGYRRVELHGLQSELRNAPHPIEQRIEHLRGAFRFAFTNGLCVGLHVSLDAPGPLTFTTFSDTHRDPDNPPRRTWIVRTHWVCRHEAVVLAPGSEAIFRRHATLINGQPLIDSAESDLFVGLDVPAYRDPGERIEASVFIGSPRPRTVRIEASRREGAGWRTYADRSLSLEVGPSQEVCLDTSAAAPATDVQITISEAGAPIARVEKRVSCGGQSDAATEYHRTYRNAVLFKGTLREMGRLAAVPGDAKPSAQGDDRAAAMLDAYRKWFPRYTQMLQGKAEAMGVPPEVCVLMEQPVVATSARDGCLDMVFRGRGRNFLAWNKERFSVEGGVPLEYSRYELSDGISFHGIAGYYANEAGLCSAGASLNAAEHVEKAGEESVRAWRAEGKFIGPPDAIKVLLMECRTVDDVERLIGNADAPLASTGNYMFADAKGGVLNWQSSGLMHVLRRPAGDWRCFTCTNFPRQWESPHGGSAAGMGAFNGHLRDASVARLVARMPEQIEVADVVRILRSHAEPGAISQTHGNSVAAYLTVMSYVMDPANQGDIYLAHSPPCQHKYYHYSLRAPGAIAVPCDMR